MNAALDPREEPGKRASAALALGVHAVLLGLLIYGIRWQTRTPQAVEVELVAAAPPTQVAAAPQRAEVRPPEAKPPAVAPPKPAPPPIRPDIALKEREKPKPPKPEAKPETKPEPKPEPDRASRQLMAETMKREQQQLDKLRAEQELTQLKAAQAAKGREMADKAYKERIARKIKSNIVPPPDIKGNPEAIFDVVQLPSGEILSVKLKKSSGHAAYDGAVERAILKSSPLPKPEQGDLFNRSLELKFRPLEE